MNRAIVELKNVSVSYNGVHAIEDVSLEVGEGDILGLLGPNGSGKTTLIKVILGLMDNCCGIVRIFGQTILGEKRRTQHHDYAAVSGLIGYVPQNATRLSSAFPGTAYEVVATGLATRQKILRPLAKEDHKSIEDTLRLTGLYDIRFRAIGELSGGEQQRVFIARALAPKPKLLILDEPTTGVDAPHQAKFYSLLENLNKEMGITVILATHDLLAMSKLANKLACMNKTLYYHGEPEAFFADERKLSELYGYPVGLISHGEHAKRDT